MSKSRGLSLSMTQADLIRWRHQVVPTATCHIWTGAVGSNGYGTLRLGDRVVRAHQVAARLRFGPIPVGATLLHDCEVRLCCSGEPGHVRIGSQGENVRQAVARGRAVGPRPGLVDVRGARGASVAVRDAILAGVAAGMDRAALAVVLVEVIAAGDPQGGGLGLFDRLRRTAPAGWAEPDDSPVDLLDPRAVAPKLRGRVESLPLF